MTRQKVDCAIIGSGNIGTDLMLKVSQLSDILKVTALVGFRCDIRRRTFRS